jgi:hypothetical protein
MCDGSNLSHWRQQTIHLPGLHHLITAKGLSCYDPLVDKSFPSSSQTRVPICDICSAQDCSTHLLEGLHTASARWKPAIMWLPLRDYGPNYAIDPHFLAISKQSSQLSRLFLTLQSMRMEKSLHDTIFCVPNKTLRLLHMNSAKD